MASPAVVEPIVQKDRMDCAIAAIAMIASRPYRDVSTAALKLWERPHIDGLTVREIKRLARTVGVTLVSVKIPNMGDEETGILVLPDHVVVLFQGVIYNPADGLLYDYTTYTSQRRHKPSLFLRP